MKNLVDLFSSDVSHLLHLGFRPEDFNPRPVDKVEFGYKEDFLDTEFDDFD